VALLEAYPELGKPLFPRGYYRQSLIGDQFTDVSAALVSTLFGHVAYGTDPEDMLGFRDETKVRLADVAGVGDRIGYEYDFGDGWEHELLIEAAAEAEAGRTYPLCIDGAGACPPEDCGGYPGYQRLKEILADPSDEEHDELKSWADSQVGGVFDPARFDLAMANVRMIMA